MFEECIKESKPRPDFSNSDDCQVSVLLGGEVQDPDFLRFLEKIGREKLATFATEDFLTLDLINRGELILPSLRSRLPHLVEHGVIEKIGRKGVRYILSRQFYKFIGRKGIYTRKRGLDHGTNKMLLLKHIQENQKEGTKFRELKRFFRLYPEGKFKICSKNSEGRVKI
jgi:ATP-dependent DNA helicase RecG